MVEEQKNIHGEKVVNQDCILIKYEGPSFENQMELHAFSKQINSMECILKETILELNKNNKISDNLKEAQFYIQLRKGSFETLFLILFSNPILINIVSDCIFSYIKYLATGLINNKYTKEIENMTKSKKVRSSTRDIINPCVQNSDKTTIVNGDLNRTTNIFVLDGLKRENIHKSLYKIENELPITEYEQEMFGKILKIDAVKSEEKLCKSKLGFVIEGGNQKPIEANFKKDISEKELKKILFDRIKVKTIAKYKSEDIVSITINSYNLSAPKKLKDYTK